jgi:hypothetical protein
MIFNNPFYSGHFTNRFNSPEELQGWAIKAGAANYREAQEKGVSLNPYCMQHHRIEWEKGYYNRPLNDWEGKSEWLTTYQRGKGARFAEIMNECIPY